MVRFTPECIALIALVLLGGAGCSPPGPAPPGGPGPVTQKGPASLDAKPGGPLAGTLSAASTAALPATRTANHGASRAAVSADGRWIVMTSAATDMIDGFRALGVSQPPYLFLHDCDSGANVLISHAFTANGDVSNALSDFADISDDGRYVVFEGHAANLVPGFPPKGGRPQVYRYDRQTNNNTLLSFSHIIEGNDPGAMTHLPTRGAAQAPQISADGRFTAYLCSGQTIVAEQIDKTPGTSDVFLYDAQADKNVLASHLPGSLGAVGNGQGCELPNVSADGRYVVFLSDSTNLVEGQEDEGRSSPLDLFVFDRTTHQVTLVSHAHDSATKTCRSGVSNSRLPQISDDGQFIVYVSSSDDLVAGLPQAELYVYLYNQKTGKNSLVSHVPGSANLGGQGIAESPVLSGDGRWIAYESEAGDLVRSMKHVNDSRNIFLYDRVADVTHLVSHAAGSTTTSGHENAFQPTLTRDGRYVAFYSDAPDHVAGQIDSEQGFDVFLYDHQTRGLTLASHARGTPLRSAGESSDMGILAADHPVVVFVSQSSQLVEQDENKSHDVFYFKPRE